MFKCFKPASDTATSSDILLGLQRSRDQATSQADALRKQLESALHKADTCALKLELCEQAKVQLQHLLEDKSAQVHQLLGSHAAIGRSLRDLLSSHGLQEQATATDAEQSQGVCLVSTPRSTSSKPPGEAAEDLDVVSEPKSPSQEGDQVERVMIKQQHGIQTSLQQLGDHVTSLQQAKVRLETQLAASKATKDHLELQSKTQNESFKVERSALESSCASLTELNGELTEQLDAAQAALAAAQAARSAAVDSEQRARSEQRQAVEGAEAAARDLAVAQAALRSSEEVCQALQQQVEELQERHQVNHAKVLEMTAAATASAARATELQSQLTDALQQLGGAKATCEAQLGQLRQLEERQAAATTQAEALRVQLTEAQHALKKSQAQEVSLGASLATAQQTAANAAREVHSLRERLAQVEAELSASQSAASASALALVATKRELVASKQQLATMAREHGQALNHLGGSDEALTVANAALQEAQASVVATRQEASQAKQQVASLSSELTSTLEQLKQVQGRADTTQGIAERLALLVHSLAGLLEPPGLPAASGKQAGILGAVGKGVMLSEEEISHYQQEVRREGKLFMQLANTPAQLLSCLVSDAQVSGSLRDLSVEVPSPASASPGDSWDNTALKTVSLAAALTQATQLQKLNLGGSAWGGGTEGLGVAAPFLALLSLTRHSAGTAPTATDGVPAPALCALPSLSPLLQMQVDTQLVGPACAALCARLLVRGDMQLSVGQNSPGLYLYTDHEYIDEWYHKTLSAHGNHPAVQHALTTANLARNTSALGMAPSHRGSSGGSSVDSHRAPSMRSGVSVPVGSTAAYSAKGQALHMPSPARSGVTHAPSMRSGVSHQTSVHTSQPLDCELINLGLDSHHMVMIMVVLLTCPGVRRLSLEGNQVGDGGAATLGHGLPHAAALQDLSLARNNITRVGMQALQLGSVGALRRLDLSHQGRGQGAGGGVAGAKPAGAPGAVDTVIAALRAGGSGLEALQELNVGGLAISEQGVMAVCALLSASACCPSLRRLVVSPALPAPTLGRLQAAAACRPSLVISVA